LLEEESQLAENKLLPNSSQTIVKLANETEITPNSEWMFEIEDDFFDDFGNTTFYCKIIQPQQSRDFNPNFSHRDDLKFLREIIRELIFILGDDWLIESEQSPEVICFNSPSIIIKLQVHSYSFGALYNPVVGVNIMSYTFAIEFLRDITLIPTNKLLKNCLGHIISSLGVLSALPIVINDFRILLNYYIFDVWDFNVMIGVPTIKLLQEGHNGKLDIKFVKEFSFSIPITHAVKVKAEPLPKLDPVEEVKTSEFDNFSQLDLEDDTQFFIDEEEEDPINPKPLDELLEPLKPPIELKPLPS